ESDDPLPAVEMGSGQDLMIGETVIAIGNPFGFSHTVTTGVISALNRSVRTDDRVYRDFIQTDASINPGNSGGPLLNIYGDLIGINTAVYAKAQGIGFAIPIDRAKKIISDLIQYGEVIQSWIGLIIQPLDDDLARYLKIPDRLRRKNGGILVKEVLSPSPARKAGIQNGDIILSIGHRPIASRADYQTILKETRTGRPLSLTLWRDSKQLEIDVKTTRFPENMAEHLARKNFGITVGDITPKNRRRYGLQTEKGVVILEMDRQAYLTRIGVRSGDVIHQIDEITVNDLNDYHKAVARYRHKSSLVILLQRKDQLYYLTVKH
ncbi:MAG: PDZ domain-containing protein, partial [Thermodesulfobacteriota bacterium]|nr:PDZ domain-containing protein [Thermodesulfobacteriota bacterium]